MKTLIITLLFFLTFGGQSVGFLGKSVCDIQSILPHPSSCKFRALVDNFLDCLLHLLFGDTFIIVFIKEIKQDCGSKIVPTTRVYVEHV